MRDFANQSIQFEADTERKNEGEISCRLCGRKVWLSIRAINILIFSASKVNIKGDWCNHSPLHASVEEIIRDSIETVENNGYF